MEFWREKGKDRAIERADGWGERGDDRRRELGDDRGRKEGKIK